MRLGIVSRAFVWRRLHSLFGLWLVLFLINHLLVNSQAALLLGDSAKGFISAVNSIHNLPYLPVIEIVLIGMPMLFHGVWGCYLIWQSKFHATSHRGISPYVRENRRNDAFILQRVTGVILMVGVVAHVIHFHFMLSPKKIVQGSQSLYCVKVGIDQGLYTVASRLNTKLYNSPAVDQEKKSFQNEEKRFLQQHHAPVVTDRYSAAEEQLAVAKQTYMQKKEKIAVLSSYTLSDHEVIAIAPDFGTASVLSVRDVFKSPLMASLYTIFVLSACFHGFNGLWTFCLTWGILIKACVQKKALPWIWGLMGLLAFLGLVAIWGTYGLNLKV